MSKQAVVRASRLRYSHPILELPPCFHRLHEPRSSCIHTNGCPCLPWHCQPHPVEVRYGGCPNCLGRSSQTRLARYRFPSTSPSRHSQCLSSHRLGRVCRPPLSPVRYRKEGAISSMMLARFGLEGSDCLADGINVPYEDSGIPIVIACGKVLLGSLQVWLFLESLNLVDFLH